MEKVVSYLNSVGESLVDFAGPMLIQSSILIITLLGLDMVLRKKVRAVVRYGIWMLVLVKLVLPVSLSMPTSLGYWLGNKLPDVTVKKAGEGAGTNAVMADEQGGESRQPMALQNQAVQPSEEAAVTPVIKTSAREHVTALSWQGVVLLVWWGGVMAMLLLLGQRMIFVRGLIAQAEQGGESLRMALEKYRKQMGVRKKVILKISPNATSPAVCGLGRPVILIPEGLPGKLSRGQLRAVLLHELAHIKRGDLWVSLVQTILQIIYFYNPLLWLANAIIRKVREQAVDEAVLVAMGEGAEDYPDTLLNVSKLAFRRPALSLRLIGVVESKKALAGRIRHMVTRPLPKRAKLGIAGLVTVLLLAAILLPMAGAQAEKESNKDAEALFEKAETQANEMLEGEQVTIKGFVTDMLGRARGNVYVASSIPNIYKASRSDEKGLFTLKVPKQAEKQIIAYCQPMRAMGLLTLPKDYDDSKPVHIRLEYTKGIVKGRVVDQDGKSVADKEIELIIKTKDGDTYVTKEKTDRWGYYSTFIPAGDGLTIQAGIREVGAESYFSPSEKLSNKQIFHQLPVIIAGGKKNQPAFDKNFANDGHVRYGGRVVNEDGEPIPQVEVQLTCDVPDRMAMMSKEILTDADGRWSLLVHREHSNLEIKLIHPDYLSFHFEWPQERPSTIELLEGSNVLVMKRGNRIQGKVIDQKGQPIENALVAAGRYYRKSPYGELHEDSTTDRTKGDGSFSIGGLPAGKVDIQVSSPEYGPKVVPVEISERMKPLEITLKGGRTYQGQIRDIEGNLVEGVQIDINEWRLETQRSLTRLTKTDAEGRFKIENLPNEGTLIFDFVGKRDAGLMGFMKQMPDDLTQPDQIVMYKRPIIAGKVIDEQSGKPITTFQVVNGIRWNATEDEIDWSRFYKKQIKSADGTFKRKWDGFAISYPFDGACYLKIEAPGYLPSVTPAVRLGEECDSFVIRLAKGEIGSVLALRIVPNIDGEREPRISQEKLREYIEKLKKYGPGMTGDEGMRWYKAWEGWDESQQYRLPKATYQGENYILLCTEAKYSLSSGQEGKRRWGLKEIKAATDGLRNPSVQFGMDQVGCELMSELTKSNIKNRMAILVDDQVYSVPTIMSEVKGRGQIVGKFTTRQVEDMVDFIRKGLEREKGHDKKVIKAEDKDDNSRANGGDAEKAGKGENEYEPVGEYALEFDGVDDFMEIQASKSLQLGRNFTIQMWVKPEFPETAISKWEKERNLLVKGGLVLGHPDEKGNRQAETYGFGLQLIPEEEGRINIQVSTGAPKGTLSVNFIKKKPSDWLHVAVVFEGDKGSVYRNMTWGITDEYYQPAPYSNIIVGKEFLTPMGNPFKGQIAEIRIWNKALTNEEIEAYKKKALDGSEPNLVGCWTFEEDEGQRVTDISPYKNRGQLGLNYGVDDCDPKRVRIK